MGTNYYLRQPACSQCGHVPAELHIGKSSSGWNFSLRIYPKIDGAPDMGLKLWNVDEICELDDWHALFDRFLIISESEELVSAAEMIAVITTRSHPNGLKSKLTSGPDWMWGSTRNETRNETLAIECVAGKGTYDLCNYEFS